MNPQKSIGGRFNLPINNLFSKNKRKLNKKLIYVSRGIDALDIIIKNTNLQSVLLPSYLCESILIPFKKNKVKISFYKINKDLTINLEEIKNKLKNNKIDSILIINYFGFIQPKLKELNNYCEKNNISLIEDSVQSAFTKHIPISQFHFNSYRKLTPIIEGSFLGSKQKLKIKFKNSFKQFLFTYTKLLFSLLKNIEPLRTKSNSTISYCEEKLIDYPIPAKMSKLSKSLLKKQDFNKIALRRRKNFLFLLNNIKNIKALFNSLPNQVVPSGFPIILKNNGERNNLRKKLIKNNIYCPIHWHLPKEINKEKYGESWNLSEKILTIPVDQRYNLEDMKRVIKILNQIFPKK